MRSSSSTKIALASACVVAAACANRVHQDAHTGTDGRVEGATAVSLESGEARVHGIVTYPGGDRVDWKQVEIPDGKHGKLGFKLQWRSPRPGLQLGFDVFDQWYAPVFQTGAARRRGHAREGILADARGKYFVRVYALGRGDAGTYQMTVDFDEAPPPPPPPPAWKDVNDPPRLAELPVPAADPAVCTAATFDAHDPACTAWCTTAAGARSGVCGDLVCPSPPTVLVPVCWATMPCPTEPDERVAACKGKFRPCPDFDHPDPTNPNCRVARPPVLARIVKNEISGDSLVVTIAAGSLEGVNGKTWTARVLRGDRGEAPLAGGNVLIIRVSDHVTIGKVRLSPDQLRDNPRVELLPPAPPLAP